MTMSSRPVAAPAASAHGGRTCSRSPIVTGRWKSRQRVGPVVGDLRRRDLDERGAGGRAQRGQRGQLARRAVDGVLDRLAVVDLLDPGRRELQQLGERDLGVGARDAEREPDHTAQRCA